MSNVLEQSSPDKYQSFKTLVMSKIIRPVDDCKDIKISIHTTLNEFINEYSLCGWVRGTNENDILNLIKDNNTLIKENNSLNKQIQKMQEQISKNNKELLGNYTFDELIQTLKSKEFIIPEKLLGNCNGDIKVNALKLFIINYSDFCIGISNTMNMSKLDNYLFFHICPYYIGFELLEKVKLTGSQAQRCQTTKLGSKFYALLESKNLTKM